jgi:antitoxin component YwqK of YwqJK toxin-antitoxin module
MTVKVDELSEDYETGEMLHLGKPFTGIAERVVDGMLRIRESYLDGLKTGPQLEWYPDGQLGYEENTFENQTHGYRREWFRNGRLRCETLKEFGLLISARTWNEQGRLIFERTPWLEQHNIDWLRKQRAEARSRGVGPPPCVDPKLLPPE